MSIDLTVREPSRELTVLTNDQLQYIAGTEFVPPGLRGNLPAILACVATGRALGIADMTALRSIHIIDGKATFSAELMVMLARQRGHSIQGSVTEGAAKVVGKRADNGDTMEVTWTLSMAERAGLTNKQNWRKYPEAMLWARAVSQLCRELFPDCFAGATYTLEELGEEHTDSAGEPSEPGRVRTGAASGVEASAAESDASPADVIDMSDPDIPFGDTAAPEPEPASAAQKKKLNVLVGKLRPERVSTEELWRMCDRPPALSEDGEVHWSPLRDQLTKGEASRLIEALTALAAGASASGSAATESPGGGAEALRASATEADELAAIEHRLVEYNEELAATIEAKRADLSDAEFAQWLRRQGANLDAKLKEGATA